jgi:hypothetical protein
MNPLSLPDDSFSLLNAEVSDKLLKKLTDLNKLLLPPEGLETRQDRLKILCFTSVCQVGAPLLRNVEARPCIALTPLQILRMGFTV